MNSFRVLGISIIQGIRHGHHASCIFRENLWRLNSHFKFLSAFTEEQWKASWLESQKNGCATSYSDCPEHHWYTASVILVRYLRSLKEQHPAAIWQAIEKYLLLYHHTTKQLLSSDCETPQHISTITQYFDFLYFLCYIKRLQFPFCCATLCCTMTASEPWDYNYQLSTFRQVKTRQAKLWDTI